MVDATDNKAVLRGRLRAARAAIGPNERGRSDEAIRRQVLAMGEWRRSDVVYAYLSFKDEVDTRALVSDALRAGKRVALPRCTSTPRELAWHYVGSLDGLVPSRFGILEPDPALHEPTSAAGAAHSLALVPGLTFDDEGFRLGYGGGYYDGFLSRFEGVSVGLCRRASRLDSLAFLGCVERHDVPVDIVIEA